MKHLVSIQDKLKDTDNTPVVFLPTFIVKNTAKFYFKLVEINIYFFLSLPQYTWEPYMLQLNIDTLIC